MAEREDGELVSTPDLVNQMVRVTVQLEGEDAVTDPEIILHAPIGDILESPFPPSMQNRDALYQTPPQIQPPGWRQDGDRYLCEVEQCRNTDLSFSRLDTLQRHWSEAHRKTVTLYFCPDRKCSYSKSRVADVRKHIKNVHPDTPHCNIPHASKKNKFYVSPKALSSPYSRPSAKKRVLDEKENMPPMKFRSVTTTHDARDVLDERRGIRLETVDAVDRELCRVRAERQRLELKERDLVDRRARLAEAALNARLAAEQAEKKKLLGRVAALEQELEKSKSCAVDPQILQLIQSIKGSK